MIELILYGAAGFLLAALLAFLIVPVLTDRAAKRATRKLKANLPFSTAEMEADKDQLKAAHAVELRKVEISLTRAKDRLTSQDLELRTMREQLEGSNKIGKAGKLAMEEMRQKEQTLNAKLREGDTKLASLEVQIRQLIREKNDLQQALRQSEQKAKSAGAAQPQITATGATLSEPQEQMTSPSGLPIADQSLALRRAPKVEETDDAGKLKELLSAEQKRAEQLNFKLAGLTADHQKLQQSMNQAITNAKAEVQKKYESEIAALKAKSADDQILMDDNDEQSVIIAADDNNIVVTAEKPTPKPASTDHAILQEKLFDVAAQITKLTAAIEGNDSIIHELLAKTEEESENSLSKRIQALMETANETVADTPTASPEKTKPAAKPRRTKIKPVTRKVRVKVPTPTVNTKAETKSKSEPAKKEKPSLPVADPKTKAQPKKLALPKAEGLVVPKKAESDA